MKSKPIQKQEQTKKQSIQNWEKIKKYLLEAHKEYKSRNGLPYCKNCGIDHEQLVQDIENILKAQEKRNKKLIKTMTKLFENKTDELLKTQKEGFIKMVKEIETDALGVGLTKQGRQIIDRLLKELKQC